MRDINRFWRGLKNRSVSRSSVSFELNGTVEEVVAFVSGRRFFALGESLGGVKALVCHPARMTHASIPAEERAKLGLPDTLIRLSTGCEHPRDLVADLLEGLTAVEQARTLAATPDTVAV